MTTRSGRASRLGWLLTTIALAIALIASSWVNHRGARDAAVALSTGQADLLEAAVRDDVMQHQGALDDALFASILASNEEAGLRFIALFDTLGSVLASAGTPIIEPVPPQRQSFGRGDLLPAGSDRVRMYMPRPLTLREMQAPPDSARAAGPPRADRRPPQRRWLLLEMEPVLATNLQARAARSLALSIAGATIITLAALLFWRTSEQYQKARLHLEEQRRLSLLGEMSAVLAHEIRNPLASLKGNAQLLAERLDPESRERARADRVISEATRLEALTSDLLDFARNAPLHVSDVDPASVLHTSIADVAEDGFEIDTVAAPQQWPMDEARIRQALVNILQNARQAAPDRRPRVRVAKQKEQLVYEVRDFGAGLPDGAADRIFDPFFTTRTNGTGLGLAVARRVAEAHGGSVSAANHPEGGAVFTIALPRG
jgi:two-component system sensor histidine kinase HydH